MPPSPEPEDRSAKPALIKRSLDIAGHRTSISIEPEFWAALQRCAEADGRSVRSLIAEIDAARLAVPGRNLSSAIRVYVLQRLAGGAKQASADTPS